MNEEIPGLKWITDFVEEARQDPVESTQAEVVCYDGTLYNVRGSTQDPIPGAASSWKKLLINCGVSERAPCYVTNTSGGVHPSFSVGGHMATSQDGVVRRGGSCFLMPLCSWHNSTSRDGEPFSHTETKMVKLTGYLEGEFAATFELRLPSKDPYALLYFSGETWEQQSLSEHQALQVEAKGPNGLIVGGNVEYYVLFERVPEIRRRHHVKAVRLSG